VAFRWADMVLPVSEALRAAIEHYGIRARFHVVPNVVDTALFAPAPNCRRDIVRKRIVFVGQLVPAKGVPGLLQALSRLGQRRRDWHLDIVGEGAAGGYEHLVANLNLSVPLATRPSERWRVPARCGLLVMASLSQTFSAPLAEAMATSPLLAAGAGPGGFVSGRSACWCHRGRRRPLQWSGLHGRPSPLLLVRTHFPVRSGALLAGMRRSVPSRGVPRYFP
jgi:glycosyltransferase involved in cell wall biosynthesis